MLLRRNGQKELTSYLGLNSRLLGVLRGWMESKVKGEWLQGINDQKVRKDRVGLGKGWQEKRGPFWEERRQVIQSMESS
jgi:hypothetical protein